MAKTKATTVTNSTPVFPGARFYSHMPFFDGTTLLFGYSEAPVQREIKNTGTIWNQIKNNPQLQEQMADLPRTSAITYRAWKLFYCPWSDRQPMRLDTGLPEGTVECSPTMYSDSKEVHVSFIGGLATPRGLAYRLYLMEGKTLKTLAPAKPVETVPSTKVGFINKDTICIGIKDGFALIERNNNQRTDYQCSLPRLLRISYRADEPNVLIITGMNADGHKTSLTYNTKSTTTASTVQNIASTISAYKPSIAVCMNNSAESF